MEEIDDREGDERDEELGRTIGESMYTVEINSWAELNVPKGYEIDADADRDEFQSFRCEKRCKEHLREKYADKRPLVDDFIAGSTVLCNPDDEEWEMLDRVEAAFQKWLKR